MSGKSKKTKDLSPREYRRQAWEAKKAEGKEKQTREEDTRKEFKKYFIQLKRKLNLDPSLENVIWLHFKSAGFANEKLFDEGIKHFGYKI